MTRGRKPNIEPTSSINLHLPESLRTRLDLILFSELEGRVPKGAYLRFFSARLVEFFGNRTLDLAPYVNALPGVHAVSGKPETLEALRTALEAKPGLGEGRTRMREDNERLRAALQWIDGATAATPGLTDAEHDLYDDA